MVGNLQRNDASLARIIPAMDGCRWLSVYVYPRLSEDLTSSRIFHDAVRSVASTKIGQSPAFFLRYRDLNGRHLRIRIYCQDVAERQTALRALEELWSCSLAGESPEGIEAGIGTLRFVKYEPELKRYGGPRLTMVTEKFFCRSSRWILAHDQALGNGHGERLLAAAICTFLFHSCQPEVGNAFQEKFRRSVNRWIAKLGKNDLGKGRAVRQELDEAWRQKQPEWTQCFEAVKNSGWLNGGETNLFSSWTDLIAVSRDELRAAAAEEGTPISDLSLELIMDSWLHTHCNRLSIVNIDEAVIARALLGYFCP